MYRLLVDFGLVVLIWIVQLIIYPGFKHYTDESLMNWHASYTRNITFIVLPLMAGQLVLHGWETYSDFSPLRLLLFVLVIGTWVITFLFAVPLHNNIASGQDVQNAVKALVRINWSRTVIWSLIFILGWLISLRN